MLAWQVEEGQGFKQENNVQVAMVATTDNFDAHFSALTANPPFRWQRRLFRHFADGNVPDTLDLPTGIGKTSVMAIWLLARAYNPALPRRLVYVVDRRAVVDQATREAEKLRQALEEKNELTAIRTCLGLSERHLPVSTLRGRLADNREWLSDPTASAIIVGTIDMVGSRLLFEGYGVSRGMRPFHAGFLGSDVLFVLDEAHLCPPFEALLRSVASGILWPAENEGRNIIPPFRLLPLSATGRSSSEKPFGLEAEDYEDKPVKRRLEAEKRLEVETLKPDDDLTERLAERAWSLRGASNRVLVYCDRRKDAEKVEKTIRDRVKKEKLPVVTNLLVGARRVREREKLAKWLEDNGFLAGSITERANPVFLVATSAGEVGIDLDADHMVCDLAPFERMIQRVGRVNRRGEGDSQVVVLAAPPKKPDTTYPEMPDNDEPAPPEKPNDPGRDAPSAEKAIYQKAKKDYTAKLKVYEKKRKEFDEKWQKYCQDRETYEKDWREYNLYEWRRSVLERLNGDASPSAVVRLKQQSIEDAGLAQLIKRSTTPEPLRPAVSRALVDAWSMTSLEQHTGRPEVAPWLRGWVDDDAQTVVAWRRFLPWRPNERPSAKEAKAFFDAAPIHLTEMLEAPTSEVIDTLIDRAVAALERDVSQTAGLKEAAPAAVIFNRAGEFQRALTVEDLAKLDEKTAKGTKAELFTTLIGKQVIISQTLGGLSNAGLLDAKADELPETLDSGWTREEIEAIGYQVFGPGQGPTGDWRTTHTFELSHGDDDESPARIAVATVRRKGAPRQGDPAISRKAQSLTEHHEWAGAAADEIARTLGFPDAYQQMLIAAARTHDAGKRRLLWQRAMNAPLAGRPYAKTMGGGNSRLLDGYRHEFGSLGDAETDAEIGSLPDDLKDLALHLIASHHGYARPVVPPIDPDVPPSTLAKRAQDSALRYARLQRRWGAWGLAWWEAVFRSADWRASQRLDA